MSTAPPLPIPCRRTPRQPPKLHLHVERVSRDRADAVRAADLHRRHRGSKSTGRLHGHGATAAIRCDRRQGQSQRKLRVARIRRALHVDPQPARTANRGGCEHERHPAAERGLASAAIHVHDARMPRQRPGGMRGAGHDRAADPGGCRRGLRHRDRAPPPTSRGRARGWSRPPQRHTPRHPFQMDTHAEPVAIADGASSTNQGPPTPGALADQDQIPDTAPTAPSARSARTNDVPGRWSSPVRFCFRPHCPAARLQPPYPRRHHHRQRRGRSSDVDRTGEPADRHDLHPEWERRANRRDPDRRVQRDALRYGSRLARDAGDGELPARDRAADGDVAQGLGDQQAAAASTALPQPLVAQVVDATTRQRGVPGVTVTWSQPPGQARACRRPRQ